MNPLNLDPNVNYLAQPRAVDVPEWRKSLAAFGDETAALGSGLKALGAQALGMPEARDQALLDYQRNMEEATAGWQAPEVGQIEDIKLTEPGGAGRLGSYLGYQVPKGIAQLGTMVVGGLGGGAIARGLASKGIKELAKAEMKNVAADVAKKSVAGAIAAPLVERAAGQQAIKQLAGRQLLGAQLGAGAGIAGMEGGQMYGQLASDPTVGPEAAVLPTLAYTGVATALEYLPLHMAGKALGLDRMLLRNVIKEDVGLAAQAAKLSLKKKALGVAGKVLTGAAAGAAVEGITEGMQNLVEQAATKYAQKDPQWASILPTSKEGWSDFWNNVVAGAAVGAVPGAVIGPFVRTQRQGEVNVPEAEATTGGAGAPTTPQQPQGPAPAEALAAAPGAASAAAPPLEVPPNVVPVPRGPEASAAVPSAPPVSEGTGETPAPGQAPSAEELTPLGFVPTHVGAAGEMLQETAAPGVFVGQYGIEVEDWYAIPIDAARGDVVKTTIPPQQASTPTEVPNAQQATGAGALHENVSRPGLQGGQEVQVSTKEGGQRVLSGGQETAQEVISRADGTPFASQAAATRKLNQLWEQGGLTIKDGPEAGKQVRARVTKQGDGYVIERLESRGEAGHVSFSTPDRGVFYGNGVLGGVERLNEDNDVTLEYPELKGVLHITGVDRQAGSTSQDGSASVALKALTDYADQKGETLTLWAKASGKLPQKALEDWYVRHGFADNGYGLMVRKPKAAEARLESRTSAPTQSTTNFVAATDFLLGQGWTQRAIDAGILEVHETSPADSASGYYEPATGKFVVNLDRTPEGQSPASVLLHEGSHAGMARMLGDQFQSFHSDLEKLADRGSETARLAVLQATQGAITAINRQRERLGLEVYPHQIGDETLPKSERGVEVQRVRNLINDLNPGLLPEEDLAYYVQLASARPPAEAGFWKRLLSAIQAWIAGTRFGKAMAAIGWRPALSPQLAVELAKQAARQTLQRAELVNQLVGERAKVLRSLPASAQLGLLEANVWHAGPTTWAPEPRFPRGRPRLDKVGTGEGGQLFGWGWYSAEHPEVSGPQGQYAKTFAKQAPLVYKDKPYTETELENLNTDPEAVAAAYIREYGSVENARKELERNIAYVNRIGSFGHNFKLSTQALKAIDSVDVKAIQEPKAFVAHLEIPDEDIKRMLQWEKPLSEQTEEVRGALEKAGLLPKLPSGFTVTFNPMTSLWEVKDSTGKVYSEEETKLLATETGLMGISGAKRLDSGEQIYEHLAQTLPPVPGEHPKKRVSEYLRSLGIVGNKYLDYGSRGAGQWTVVYKTATGESKTLTSLSEKTANLYKQAHPDAMISQEPGTFNYVVWDQSVLDRIGQQHLDWQTGERLESRQIPISSSWWRSGVASAIASASQQKAAPQQWLGWLKNQPGVKQEEIEDLGLEDWLSTQTGSVTKGEMERFVQEGGVKIEEVVKGGQADFSVDYYLTKTALERLGYQIDGEVVRRNGRLIEAASDAGEDAGLVQALYDAADQPARDVETKFAAYQIPGGENYRELLITAPGAKTAEQFAAERDAAWEKIKVLPGFPIDSHPIAQVRWARESASEALFAEWATASEGTRAGGKLEGQYTSSHWSEPNVLVHIRFNERTDVEGKRVLFVEEVQSDWHQEGRKKGYKGTVPQVEKEKAASALIAATQALEAATKQFRQDNGYSVDLREIMAQGQLVKARYDTALNADPNIQKLREEKTRAQTELSRTEENLAVPSAPFKSAWPLLGMKRAIRWAAMNGFDKVAWTPGEVQAERYDLSKQVQSISAFHNGNNTWELDGITNDNQTITLGSTIPENKLADYVGKALADKIVSQKEAATERNQVFSGADLRVGGEGMRGFYDKILPNELQKYIKKFGGKVGETEIVTGSRANNSGDPNDVLNLNAPIPVTQPVWSLTLTPALRDEALSGQLLYSIPPLNTWPELSTWFTSPVSTYSEDFNKPGEFNKAAHALVDRFHYVKDKSPGLYRAFDEWKNRQGALQKEVERIYEVPLRQLVSRYKVEETDIEPIRRTEIANGKATPDTQYTKVEVLGHQLAVRHVLEDKVTEQLALRAAPEFLKELKKQLSPHNVGLLNADIKAATQGSTSIENLSNTEARQLFLNYLPSADPQSDIGDRWALYNRRSAGYSIATPGSTEALEDAVAGFINAHEIYTQQIANREIFQQITALTDQLAAHQLKMLQEGGLLTQTEVDNLSRAYPHFVPLRREAFDYGLELKEIFEKPRQSIGKLMTRDGSIEVPSAVHVLQNHLASGFTAASAAARNQMMNKFYDVVNADRDGWKPWFYFSDKRKNNGAMGLIRDGATVYIVPADGNLRAASIAKVIVGQDAQGLSGPLKLMRTINNWIRWSNVSASPAFLLANAPRDYLTARYNLLASDAAAYAKEIGSWSSYKESFKALHKVLVQGVRESTDSQEQAWIELVEDFEKAGGKTSFVEALRAMDGESWKSFEAQVGRREGKQRAVVEWGRDKLEWIENLNEAFENVMRLSTYKVMRDKVGKERAAEIARNLTTNFTRRGAHIDTINTWWLFYNATVQGNWQVIQNMFLNPDKVGQRRLQKAVVGTIVFAFMVDQLGRALSDDEDKDGISDWDSRTSWDKERKISSPFKVGGVYPSIPAPWVFNVFWRLGGMLGEVKDGVLKPQDAVMDSIGLTLTTMNPISGQTPAQFIAPSSFDPFMQIIENKDFMGNPLGPDGYPGASKRPDAYLAWDSTPEGFKSVAQFVNEVTGGSPVESGKVDLRPSSLKVLTDFALGGLGRSVVELGRLGLSPVMEGMDFEGPEKVPGAKVFLSAPSDSTAISLYHDRVAQVLGAKRLEKLYSEGNERNSTKLAEVQQARAAVLRMVPQVEDTERQIKALRKTLRSAQARDDSRTEEQLRERIVQLQKRFNQSFSRRIGN